MGLSLPDHRRTGRHLLGRKRLICVFKLLTELQLFSIALFQIIYIYIYISSDSDVDITTKCIDSHVEVRVRI